jgi:hypothetical protein
MRRERQGMVPFERLSQCEKPKSYYFLKAILFKKIGFDML